MSISNDPHDLQTRVVDAKSRARKSARAARLFALFLGSFALTSALILAIDENYIAAAWAGVSTSLVGSQLNLIGQVQTLIERIET